MALICTQSYRGVIPCDHVHGVRAGADSCAAAAGELQAAQDLASQLQGDNRQLAAALQGREQQAQQLVQKQQELRKQLREAKQALQAAGQNQALQRLSPEPSDTGDIGERHQGSSQRLLVSSNDLYWLMRSGKPCSQVHMPPRCSCLCPVQQVPSIHHVTHP